MKYFLGRIAVSFSNVRDTYQINESKAINGSGLIPNRIEEREPKRRAKTGIKRETLEAEIWRWSEITDSKEESSWFNVLNPSLFQFEWFGPCRVFAKIIPQYESITNSAKFSRKSNHAQ